MVRFNFVWLGGFIHLCGIHAITRTIVDSTAEVDSAAEIAVKAEGSSDDTYSDLAPPADGK